MGQKTDADTNDFDAANALATHHTLWGSNVSRMASLEELVALYAANFTGGTNQGKVGALQPISNASSIGDSPSDNRPVGWNLLVFLQPSRHRATPWWICVAASATPSTRSIRM